MSEVDERYLHKSLFFPVSFLYPSLNTFKSLLFCQNTPKYPHLHWRASNGVPGHDLSFYWLKEVQDENELMFGGSDSGGLMAYFGNLVCFWAFL